MSSDGDGGELCERGDGQEESDNASKGWSDKIAEYSVGSETEEEAMTAGGAEGGRETLTATPWGTQDSGAGAVHGGTRVSRGDTGKSPSAATDEAGARAAMGRGRRRGGKGEAGGKIRAAKPWD